MSGSPGTITGHVTDAACLMRHPAAGAPNSAQTLKCAQDCIAAGSPLVVLTAQGKLYFVISGTTPDVSQNKKYLPYVGKYVKATGRLLERDGIRAIAIESMEVVPAEK